MLNRLLRRLQGRPTSAPIADASNEDVAPAPAFAADEAAVEAELPGDAVLLTPHELSARFVRHLLGAPADAPIVDGLADDILDRLDTQSQRLDVARLPRLPALVPQLLSALRRDDVDSNAIAALLARDPTLAGDVVRVANSAHYRRGSAIATLPQAVNTIGSDGLRYVVLTTVMRPILQADPSQQAAQSGVRLAEQSEARTWLCGALARGACDVGEAQLASVIASTGIAALMRMMPRPLMTQAAADAAFGPRFLALAADVSTRAAVHWRLDEPLRQALQALARSDEDAAPLTRVLTRADRLSMLRVLRQIDASNIAVSTDSAERMQDTRLLASIPGLAEPVAA
ncbi:HDOD domain-containing protein [Cognatilysobacter terrigena]|uniref:HDOD domain-containing protein n=1 Tax=Cognatilysobacter terrigena TaxID=2488749 RepID=UPI00105F84A0|nr:HDOD domain-containing protein [Lysobacter terrigena]